MSTELEEAAAPETAEAAPEQKRRRIWPLLAWCAVGGVIVVTGAVAALGVTGALIAGGCTAGALAGGVVLWRLPQLRRHFARRGGARMRSSQTRTRRMSLGGGRKGKLPGLGGRKGSGLLGRKGKAAGSRIGKALTGKGRAAGKGILGKLGKGRATGKGRSGGKGILGRISGRSGKGRAGGKPTGKGAAGGKRPGLARRAWRRLTRRSSARRSAAGGGKKPGTGKKASRGRKAAAIAGAAVLLPVAAAAAAVKRIRAWIRKRRGKSPPAPASAAGKPAAGPAPEKPPPDTPPARRPGLPLAPNTTDNPSTRRHPVTSQLDAVSEAIDSGIGGFEPENVEHLGLFLQGLPGVYESLTSGLNRLADRFGDELPLHPAVVEHIREMASSAAGLFEYSSEAYQIFRSSHEDDLERLENPRPGEEFMDASRQ